MDASVIIHPDSTSALEELSTTKSLPHKPIINGDNKSSKTKSLSPQHGPSNPGRHSRDVSVGTLIPSRYLNQAPSLIALLDVQKTPNTSRPSSSRYKIPINSIIPSKSLPDYNDANTPTVASDVHYGFNTKELAPLQGSNDFDAPSTQINGDASTATVKMNKSRGSTENIFANGSLKYNDSEDNIIVVPSMQLEDNTTVQSMDSVVIHTDANGGKAEEYASMIPAGDNDRMVDMQLLAVKAAEEFAVLANENDKLFKENSALKEQYDDMQHEKMKIEEELNLLKNRNQDEEAIVDDIDILKSQAQKWELEKKVLMEQLAAAEAQNGSKSQNGKDPLVGKTALRLKNDTSEDAQRLMMESLAKVQREKNELEIHMEQEKNMKREYEKTISNLKKQLKDNEVDRQILSSNLDKQQKLYLSLKESHKKKELEIDNIVGRTRTLTMEEEEQVQKDKMELLEAVDEQKAYIEQLEAENQKLMQSKIKSDDDMFMELKQLRTHRFARSMQLDAISNLAPSEYESHHSRGGSQSISNYSNSGFAYFHTTNPSDAGLQLKAIRTQMNLFGQEEDEDETHMINYSIKEEETKTDLDIDSDGNDDKLNAPKEKKKVSFIDPKSVQTDKEKAEKEKEEKKRRMMEEKFKVNAEIEFFLMTCIAVKQNLAEEYPDKPEVMTENAMKLFEEAQKEHIIMSKFNLWIELKLREKYDLPILTGFKKFMEKHHIAEKFDKSKQKTKKLAKKTGQLISAKTEEFAGRIRGLSKGGYNSDNEDDKGKDGEYKQQDTLTEAKETNDDGNTKDVKIDIKDNDNKDGKTDTKDTKTDTNKGDDNPPPNNNEQCCVIL